jgi:N12 class adenine-specific DNA methylase
MIEYELMPHQKEAVYTSMFKKELYLAFEVGTGKTPACINILRQRYTEHSGLMNTLILGPLILLKNWKKEFAKFSKIPPSAIHILQGPVKKRIQFVCNISGPSLRLDFYINIYNAVC